MSKQHLRWSRLTSASPSAKSATCRRLWSLSSLSIGPATGLRLSARHACCVRSSWPSAPCARLFGLVASSSPEPSQYAPACLRSRRGRMSADPTPSCCRFLVFPAGKLGSWKSGSAPLLLLPSLQLSLGEARLGGAATAATCSGCFFCFFVAGPDCV
jgi:hypothetical protein